MIKRLKETDKFRFGLLISLIAAFGITMVIFRMYRTDSAHFLFLIWNLFLAGIPWLISSLLILFPIFRRRLIFLIPGIMLWLLFVPNSFYIITDLFYLQYKNLAPVWYDLILIFSFAWAGIALGFSGLKDIEIILKDYLKKSLIAPVISILLFLIAFGIYLGRFLRWNSWDLINQPKELLYDIGERIVYPFDHPSTWGMTVLTGLLLNFIWWTFKLFTKTSSESIHTYSKT
jgi:uncharacterized membrane protein